MQQWSIASPCVPSIFEEGMLAHGRCERCEPPGRSRTPGMSLRPSRAMPARREETNMREEESGRGGDRRRLNYRSTKSCTDVACKRNTGGVKEARAAVSSFTLRLFVPSKGCEGPCTCATFGGKPPDWMQIAYSSLDQTLLASSHASLRLPKHEFERFHLHPFSTGRNTLR